MNWAPLSEEDIQARVLSMMHQPVKLGDRVIGHVGQVEPLRRADGHYTGRFTVLIDSEDLFMKRQVLDGVHWPMSVRKPAWLDSLAVLTPDGTRALRPQEQVVLLGRLSPPGTLCQPVKIFRQIAEELGVSASRVQQIERGFWGRLVLREGVTVRMSHHPAVEEALRQAGREAVFGRLEALRQGASI